MNIRKFGVVNGLTNQPVGLDVGAGINTGDATATAGDLGNGKTAYNATGKITGNGANLGNAVVGDVLNGDTFSSANGTLITGTGANAKRYATGTITSSSGTTSFTDNLGGAVTAYTATVTGLNFPQGIDTILVTIGNYDDTFYSSHQLANTAAYIFFSQGGTAKMLKMTNASVTTTGFILPVYSVSTLYTWYAWGL